MADKAVMKKGTSVFENGLIWFGAGVSIAEILTGTYLAPLGFGKGLAAILLGHLIGCCCHICTLILFFHTITPRYFIQAL